MKQISFFVAFLILVACSSDKPEADLLIKNATIYTVNDNFDIARAFVIKEGKILEVGEAADLELKYKITDIYDAMGQTIVPGLIDAHAHLYGLGVSLQNVDLVGASGLEETLERVVAFQKEKKARFIYGRGWDQNDWEIKEFPTRWDLDSLFPDTPVALRRVDGHALWVNSKALELAGITSETKMEGGEVILINGVPSGILIDAPMGLVLQQMPELSKREMIQSLKDAEKKCLENGLTTVNDAGLDKDIIELIDSLQQSGEMSLRVYAMVSNTKSNLDHYLNHGKVKTNRLNVRSVKVYGDGALGSRGAALRAPYSDQSDHFGAMITHPDSLEKLANRIAAGGFQMNTHAIGDSANVAVLRVYEKVLQGKNDARWKVEHAQIVSPSDFNYFSQNIIPSVQPTHATSDMYWAEDRVGSERIRGAYAYKTLLEKAGIIALGTDFPVEAVNPMHTFYAATERKDLKNYPEGGYRVDEALSREETLKGMTIWAAYSNFEEDEKGSLEPGKFADFTILDKDIMSIPADSIPNVKIIATFINGEMVYSKE